MASRIVERTQLLDELLAVAQQRLEQLTAWSAGASLPNTSLIVVDNESVHGVFPYGTDDVDRPVIEFLLGGDRPSMTIVAPGKPMPLESTTYESWTPLTRTESIPATRASPIRLSRPRQLS